MCDPRLRIALEILKQSERLTEVICVLFCLSFCHFKWYYKVFTEDFYMIKRNALNRPAVHMWMSCMFSTIDIWRVLLCSIKCWRCYAPFNWYIRPDLMPLKLNVATKIQWCVIGCDSSETIYLHNALEDGWGMESNPVESCWFYQTSLWNQLCRNIAGSGSCKLPPEKDLFCWPPLFRGGTPTRIQTVPSDAGINHPPLQLLPFLHFYSYFTEDLSHESSVLPLQKPWCFCGTRWTCLDDLLVFSS